LKIFETSRQLDECKKSMVFYERQANAMSINGQKHDNASVGRNLRKDEVKRSNIRSTNRERASWESRR